MILQLNRETHGRIGECFIETSAQREEENNHLLPKYACKPEKAEYFTCEPILLYPIIQYGIGLTNYLSVSMPIIQNS